jgi:transposase
MEDVNKIEALLDLGWSNRRIAKNLGIHRTTVSRYARLRAAKPTNLIAGSGDLQNRPNPIAGSEVRRRPAGPASMAEPYRDRITKAVEQGLSAQRIWQDLVDECGYPGGYLTVQRSVRWIRRARPEVADVMEHPPGDEAQADFFKSPALVLDEKGKWRRPWVLRLTLSCSRHGYEEGSWGQERAGFMRIHEHAFEAWGGVPKVIRHDNLKSAVVRACLYDPDVSEVYDAFARHWGFVALPSRPHHPQEQGVQERSGGYLKHNALKGRRFESLAEHNRFLQYWNRTVAQLRIHGTTRRQVLAHFLEVEKPALQPLPGTRFERFEVGTRTVHPDGFVEVEGSYYPVLHHLIHQPVRVRWDDRLVRIFHNGQEVRVHLREHRKGIFVPPDPADRPAHKPARQQAYQANLLARAERVGQRALAWAKAAIVERDVRAYRLLQGMLSLTRTHPKERVDWACGVALESRSFRYQVLRRLVENAARRTPAAEPRLTQHHEVIRPLGQYAELAASW